MRSLPNARSLYRKGVQFMSDYSMRQYADDFIVYKKAIGYIYDSPARTLYRYVEFVESTSPHLVQHKLNIYHN